MKDYTKRMFSMLAKWWAYVICSAAIVLMVYVIMGMYLPPPKEPASISLEGSLFESVFTPFDGQFVAVHVTRAVSQEESKRYVKDWQNLNDRFDRRDLSELIGFDRPITHISHIKCAVKIDCRNRHYLRFDDRLYDSQGHLVHIERRRKAWEPISAESTVDGLAVRFCPPLSPDKTAIP